MLIMNELMDQRQIVLLLSTSSSELCDPKEHASSITDLVLDCASYRGHQSLVEGTMIVSIGCHHFLFSAYFISL